MKIYAVSRGSYSDYEIVGLFSSSEKAEAFMRAYPTERHFDSWNDIQEFELDQELPDPAQRGLSLYCVTMRRNGDVVRVVGEYDSDNSDNTVYWLQDRDAPQERWTARFTMWARDKNHAVKIANERRIQAIAMNDR